MGCETRERAVAARTRQWACTAAVVDAAQLACNTAPHGDGGQRARRRPPSGRGGRNRSCASMPTLMHCDTNCTAHAQPHAPERSIASSRGSRQPSGLSRGSAGVHSAKNPLRHGIPPSTVSRRGCEEAAEVGGVAYDMQHAREKCNASGTRCKTASAHVPAIAAASGRTRSPCRGRGAGSHASTPAAESAQRPAGRRRSPRWHAWRTS